MAYFYERAIFFTISFNTSEHMYKQLEITMLQP